MSGQYLGIDGERESGQDVREANVTAAGAIANVVKSSLGPVGLDKMLVDQIGDVTITNDGATILKQLEVEHPAAKVLVELSQLQDQEVGDGTTSVVIVAAELLRRANQLVKNKIHPTSIIAGFRRAMKLGVAYIKSNMTVKADTLGRQNLLNAAKTPCQEDYWQRGGLFAGDGRQRGHVCEIHEKQRENRLPSTLHQYLESARPQCAGV